MAQRRKNNGKDSASQLISFVRDSYLDRTSRPIYALWYLLGFIIIYEIGTILISPEALSRSFSETQIRVVSFVWLQNMLEYVGFSKRMTCIATPFVVIIILIALQITSKSRWYVSVKDFVPMTLECILLAVPLIVLSLLFNRTAYGQAVSNGVNSDANPLIVDIVTGIGAGIYEELVFRLILICLLMLLFQDFLVFSKGYSIVFSVVISALLFSAHHHVFFVNNEFGTGEVFSAVKFIFRFLAGIYFAVLFAVRGFAITAGTHAFYDILAAVLNAYMFSGAGSN